MGDTGHTFTIVGAAGFVGSHLLERLRSLGYACYAPARDDPELMRRPLGHVIYCAGLTADFRRRPHDTMRAHVSLVNELLERASFESLLYLSSTRVYIRSTATGEEAPLVVSPADPEDIFNLSKLAGESVCLGCGRDNVRVARLSNVLGEDFGSDNFVFALIREARRTGAIVLHTTLDSEKDYIHVDDATGLLVRIALAGRERVYNVASGRNLSNADIVEAIRAVLPVTVRVAEGARRIAFAPIDTARIAAEFGFRPRQLAATVSALAAACLK